ncbi:uncharacterized protein LOC142765891 [Rhipicephalus microplus]|uniref:uncharacterized protein LOC142765891 n=1 Tax=Rhipicephalus microplus TaxID=6941 RepID=UPI003F6D7BEF
MTSSEAPSGDRDTETSPPTNGSDVTSSANEGEKTKMKEDVANSSSESEPSDLETVSEQSSPSNPPVPPSNRDDSLSAPATPLGTAEATELREAPPSPSKTTANVLAPVSTSDLEDNTQVPAQEDAPIVSRGYYILPDDRDFDKATQAPSSAPLLTASRIDRTYLPDFLLSSVEACEVLFPPADLASSSNHLPFITTFKGYPGFRNDNQRWRLDSVLLRDETSTEQVTPDSWDALKAEWRRILQEEEKSGKRRITARLNEILRRIRIIRGADTLTACTWGYLDTLEAEYTSLLQQRALRPSRERDDATNGLGADPNDTAGNGQIRITSVRRPDGSSTTDADEIRTTSHDYFAALFWEADRESTLDSMRQTAEICQHLARLTQNETESMSNEASEDEVKIAVMSMPPNSVPGSDGLTANFYSTFFDEVKGVLLHMANTVLSRHLKPPSFGEGMIVLLLKKGAQQEDLSAWCPVTLLPVDCQIVASSLNSRLRPFLHAMVSPQQSCTVPGRSIFANLMVTRDVFEYMSTKSLSGAFISLDQAKAFNRVKHQYMFEVLHQFGLPASFVDVIVTLYSNLSGRVMVNRDLTPTFEYAQGIRQGCPLGPTLFILTLELLLTTIDRNDRIRGFQMRALGELTAVDAVKVLGIYFCSNGVAATTWRRAQEWAQGAIDRLKCKDLTIRERALAATTIICAFAYYVSRTAVMPTKTAKWLTKMIGAFLWDGKPKPIRRILLHLPSNEGGHGLTHVLITSKVLALKTARALFKTTEYVGRNMMRYWCSTNATFLNADRPVAPIAETLSHFYRAAANTIGILEKEAPDFDVDETPPARTAEDIARH